MRDDGLINNKYHVKFSSCTERDQHFTKYIEDRRHHHLSLKSYIYYIVWNVFVMYRQKEIKKVNVFDEMEEGKNDSMYLTSRVRNILREALDALLTTAEV